MKLSKNGRIFILLLLSFASLNYIYAESIKDDISLAKKEAKNSGRVFHQIVKGDEKIYLLPRTEFSEQTKDFVFGENPENSAFAAEVLYFVTKDELIKNSSSQDKDNIDTSIKATSKAIRSVSKMKGMKYFSNSKGKWDILYSESYRIENPSSKIPLEDLTEGTAEGKTIYLYQKEHTFGKGIYKIDYKEKENVVALFMQNEKPLSYGIIEAVKPQKCKIIANIIEEEDGYFVYLAMNVDFVKVSFLEKKMSKSFQARLDAICNWMTYQY